MSRDVDELVEAIERNTKANERLSKNLQDLCNSVNDMVVVMESPEYFDDGDDFEESELSEFSFKAPGSGTA